MLCRAKENSEILTDMEHLDMNLKIAKYILKQGYENKKIGGAFYQRIQVRNSCGGYVHVKEKNVEDIKKYCREIGEKNNLPVAFNNPYFRYVNQVISADQLGILGI